jgi:hypothetical protein
MTPNVADALFGIQNDEFFTGLSQVVAHHQAGLSAADDHRGNRFDAVGVGWYEMHALCSHDQTVEARLGSLHRAEYASLTDRAWVEMRMRLEVFRRRISAQSHKN